jgi:hypothetical protein
MCTKYYSGDEIKKSEMGGAFSICGEEEIFTQGFDAETCRKRDHLENPGLDEK